MFSQISDYMHFITGDWISNKCSAIIHIAEIHWEQIEELCHIIEVGNQFQTISPVCVGGMYRQRGEECEKEPKVNRLIEVCVFVERDWEEKRTDVNSQLVSHRFPDRRLRIQEDGERRRRPRDQTGPLLFPYSIRGNPKIRACEGWLTHILVGKAVLSSHVCIVVILHLHYIL